MWDSGTVAVACFNLLSVYFFLINFFLQKCKIVCRKSQVRGEFGGKTEILSASLLSELRSCLSESCNYLPPTFDSRRRRF